MGRRAKERSAGDSGSQTNRELNCLVVFTPAAGGAGESKILFRGAADDCRRYVELRIQRHTTGVAAGTAAPAGDDTWILSESASGLSALPITGTLQIISAAAFGSAAEDLWVEKIDQRWGGSAAQTKAAPVLPLSLRKQRPAG